MFASETVVAVTKNRDETRQIDNIEESLSEETNDADAPLIINLDQLVDGVVPTDLSHTAHYVNMGESRSESLLELEDDEIRNEKISINSENGCTNLDDGYFLTNLLQSFIQNYSAGKYFSL